MSLLNCSPLAHATLIPTLMLRIQRGTSRLVVQSIFTGLVDWDSVIGSSLNVPESLGLQGVRRH